MVTKETSRLLVTLANKYESTSFLEKDPSQFMHRFKDPKEQEIVAFLAANMAFGQRKQILSHTESVISASGNSIYKWVQAKGYRSFFTEGDKSFYRMYTHNDFIVFFDTINMILFQSGSIGEHIQKLYLLEKSDTTTNYLAPIICNLFPKNCNLIPHTKDTAAKRINMFLRWMTRTNSPVDLGLWSSWYSQKNLLIPLDTHVMQEAAQLGLLRKTKSGNIPSPSLKTDIELTSLMNSVFPGDPCRADYALFGLGVDK